MEIQLIFLELMTMGEMKKSVDNVMQMMGELSKQQPETMRHFKAFMGSTLKEGVLDTKTKELVAVETSHRVFGAARRDAFVTGPAEDFRQSDANLLVVVNDQYSRMVAQRQTPTA